MRGYTVRMMASLLTKVSSLYCHYRSGGYQGEVHLP